MQKHVLEYLEATAARFPQKVAFADDTRAFTFSQLEDLARRCGTALAKQLGTINRPVAVLTDRTALSVVAFLGVLYSGNYYVPIDSAMPQQRMELQLNPLAPAAFLFPQEAPRVEEHFHALYPCLSLGSLTEEPEDPALLAKLRAQILDVDPVYMIFTSGSTGVPKGIVCHHRGVIDLADWLAQAGDFTQEDVLGNQAPFYFDGSVKDLYITLKTGATCQILPKKLFSFPKLLTGYLNDRNVTALQWATSAFHLAAASGVLERQPPKFVRIVLAGGEAMLASDLNRWRNALPQATFINLYGPTEITVDATWYKVDRDFADDEAIPIGRPCANKEILLLDEKLRPVEPGQVGEICVRGVGLAHGYYGDWKKTASAFIQNPLNPWYADLIYRTGDLGFWGEDGLLYFSNRQDGQVKHMGYRIELGEVETALHGLAGIDCAACFFDGERDKLVCFYQGDLEVGELANALRERLPRYMIPNLFFPKNPMPRNANGKIDRPRLRREYDESH